MQRRHHYEQAFEGYLRGRRIPYVAVNEARKALLPQSGGSADNPALKSFDFVLYGEASNLLVEIKGRRLMPGARRPRLECWATQDDVDSLRAWEGLFGADFVAAFVFIYWCEALPAGALFEELIEHHGRWYALRTVPIATYVSFMRPRSPRWRTVYLPVHDYERACIPVSQALGLGREAVGA